jgi:hypothetical protein
MSRLSWVECHPGEPWFSGWFFAVFEGAISLETMEAFHLFVITKEVKAGCSKLVSRLRADGSINLG